MNYFKITTFFSLIVSCLLVCLLNTYAQTYKFETFDLEQGLPNNFINTICQDTNSYLWVGTGEGLISYNGQGLRNYTTREGLAENFVTISFLSKNGSVWFGHNQGGLTMYDYKSFTSINLELNSTITGITEDSQGNILICSQSGAVISVHNDNSIQTCKFDEPDRMISGMEILLNDRLLLATGEGLLIAEIKNGKINIIKEIQTFKGHTISSISKNRDVFYIGCNDLGLFQFALGNDQDDHTTKIAGSETFEDIQSVTVDNNGDLWISTFGNGIVKLSHDNNNNNNNEFENIEVFNIENGLPSNFVKTIFEDRESNIWIGTFGNGLLRKLNDPFVFYHQKNQAISENVLSVYCGDGNIIWLGLDNGLVKMNNTTSEILQLYDASNSFVKDKVTSIHATTDNKLLIGTRSNGAFSFDLATEKFKKITTKNDLLSKSVNCITTLNDEIWIGTDGGIFRIKNNEIKNFTTTDGLKHNVINDLYVDINRLYFVSIANALSYILGDSIGDIVIPQLQNYHELVSIDRDKMGNFWLATAETGIVKIDGNNLTSEGTHIFDSKDGLKSDYCYSLVVDSKSNIWIGHRGGISFFDQESSKINVFGTKEGITANLNKNATCVDSVGNIWFGTTKGLIRYVQKTTTRKTIAPHLQITGIKINDKNIDINNGIKLPYGEYKIQVNFLAICLEYPNDIKYSYMLEGHDNEFHETNTNDPIVFNKISEGQYNIKLLACSKEGVWTANTEEFSIYIDIPFWKKWWVILFFVSIIVTATYILVKARFARLKRLKEELEEELEKRTKEIVIKNTELEKKAVEIASKNKELETKNRNITDSIEYALTIQKAILPSKKLIRSYFPESFIFYKPKDIVSGDFYRFDKIPGKAKFLLFCADCTGHGVPGAFMSMIGNALIKDIITMGEYTNLGELLTQLNQALIDVMFENRENVKDDGMDISVCEIDFDNDMIHFASAYRPVVVVKNGELTWHKGTKCAIGGQFRTISDYPSISMKMEQGDIIYMFSDGYADQFGGPQGRKFKTDNLKLLLSQINHLPMTEQYKIIKQTHKKWISYPNPIWGKYEQIDDILVMGIKIE